MVFTNDCFGADFYIAIDYNFILLLDFPANRHAQERSGNGLFCAPLLADFPNCFRFASFAFVQESFYLSERDKEEQTKENQRGDLS